MSRRSPPETEATTIAPRGMTVHSFESLYEADAEARRIAGELIAEEAVAR